MSRHVPEHNHVLLNNQFLNRVLDDLSDRLLHYFGQTVRLVIHGGAVMVLHKNLLCRKDTRDVDYLHRSFETEWKRRGVKDAGDRLNTCIAATAERFGLGLDWMNAHADVALPMAYNNHGQLYDPIYTDATQPTNIALNTVYQSRGLQLIGVSWSWAVALKLVRYQKDDPQDIAAILKLGSQIKGLQWTRQIMEDWLLNMCSPMGYKHYPLEQIQLTRQKMRDAVQRAQGLAWPSHQASVPPSLSAPSAMTLERPASAHPNAFEHGAGRSQERTLRQRTKSISHLPSRSAAAPLSASSSMPTLVVPQPMKNTPPYMVASVTGNAPIPAVPGYPIPVPVSRLPRGFMPYISTPPMPQFTQHHPLVAQRIRAQS